jgi:hypothetical protein
MPPNNLKLKIVGPLKIKYFRNTLPTINTEATKGMIFFSICTPCYRNITRSLNGPYLYCVEVKAKKSLYRSRQGFSVPGGPGSQIS